MGGYTGSAPLYEQALTGSDLTRRSSQGSTGGVGVATLGA